MMAANWRAALARRGLVLAPEWLDGFAAWATSQALPPTRMEAAALQQFLSADLSVCCGAPLGWDVFAEASHNRVVPVVVVQVLDWLDVGAQSCHSAANTGLVDVEVADEEDMFGRRKADAPAANAAPTGKSRMLKARCGQEGGDGGSQLTSHSSCAPTGAKNAARLSTAHVPRSTPRPCVWAARCVSVRAFAHTADVGFNPSASSFCGNAGCGGVFLCWFRRPSKCSVVRCHLSPLWMPSPLQSLWLHPRLSITRPLALMCALHPLLLLNLLRVLLLLLW